MPWDLVQAAHDPQHPMLYDVSDLSWQDAAAAWQGYKQALTIAADAAPPGCLRP